MLYQGKWRQKWGTGGGALLLACWCLLLTGCSVLGSLMVPSWVEDADLIVVNQNERPVYAVTVTAEDGSGETLADAGGRALLERGESCGLYLEETGPVTLSLSGEGGEELASCSAQFRGGRLVLTYTREGRVTVQMEAPREETAPAGAAAEQIDKGAGPW